MHRKLRLYYMVLLLTLIGQYICHGFPYERCLDPLKQQQMHSIYASHPWTLSESRFSILDVVVLIFLPSFLSPCFLCSIHKLHSTLVQGYHAQAIQKYFLDTGLQIAFKRTHGIIACFPINIPTFLLESTPHFLSEFFASVFCVSLSLSHTHTHTQTNMFKEVIFCIW